MSDIESFYEELKSFKQEINKRTSRTIADEEYKSKANSFYERWKIDLSPISFDLGISIQGHAVLDQLFLDLRNEADKRQASTSYVQSKVSRIVDVFFEDMVLPSKKKQSIEPTKDLMENTKFLGLDTNWSIATCALQIQEVSIKLVAEKLGIDLSQGNVERILNAKFQPKDFGFNQQYEAFLVEVKRLKNIDMPLMTTHFRRMRVKVLHEGYNPQKEEKDGIVIFSIGLLNKLESICVKNGSSAS